ncbi:MAG: insulinase family protein [Clostridia bacterium]|nr:insulinase family protein [Clostridia bacterium]
MNIYQKQLTDGVRLHVIPKDTFKTDFLMMCFHVPLCRERVSQYSLLPAVLGRGCAEYPSLEELSARLDWLYNAGIGGRAYKLGDTQAVAFSVRCLERACTPEKEDLFRDALDTLRCVLLHPLTENGAFLSAYVEGEKKNLIETIRSQINNKTSYAVRRLEEEMCREEPYGIPSRGDEDTASRITPKELYRSYREMLEHAPAEIYYVGKRSPEEIVSVTEAVFAEWFSMRGEIDALPQTVVVRRAETVQEICEDQLVTQSQLCIGYRTDAVLSDGDYYRFALFNELLGGSASSKLFLQLREAMGLCYHCSSIPEGQKGLLYVTCGIRTEDRARTEDAIYKQLQAVASGQITDEEFEAAKKSLIGGYREIEDSAAALVGWYCNRYAAGIDTSPAEAAEQVRSCTKEQIVSCAKKLSLDTVYFLRGTLPDEETEEGCADDESY